MGERTVVIQVTAIVALAVAGCGGGEGSLAGPSPGRRVRSVDFVTWGGNAAYSAARDQIAFNRFDPSVIGAPDLLGDSDGTGTLQLWIAGTDGSGERCLTCADVPGGPRRNQHVGAPTWHPSGDWLVVAVEMPAHLAPHAKCHAGLGAYVDLWAASADGRRWHPLTRYANAATSPRFADAPVGALIPRFSRSGRQLVWAEMIGYDDQHPFGIWRLALAEFVVDSLGPRLAGKVTATPGAPGTTFYEAWSFSPDDAVLTVAARAAPSTPATWTSSSGPRPPASCAT